MARSTKWLLAAASVTVVAGLLALVLGTAWLSPRLAGAHPFGPFGRAHGEGDHAALLDFWVDRTLGKVDATAEQRAQVAAVIEGLQAKLALVHGSREQLHASAIELFTAAEIDAEAVERMRSEQLERVDRLSRDLTAALVEIGRVLTPEQRRSLVELHGEHRQHGHFMH
jgi:Spy/CpxP family protein refolding chaperone